MQWNGAKKFVAITLPTMLISVLVLECGLRMAGYVPYYLDGNMFVPSDSPQMLYELRAGFHGLYARAPTAVNAMGFRGSEPENKTSGDRLRIALVGDSVAFGQGVRDDQTLAERLAPLLTSKLDRPVEVLNFGVPGYNTCQEASRFEQRALPFNPSVLLLVYVDNDTDPPPFVIREGRVISPDVQTWWLRDLRTFALRESVAYNFLSFRWQVAKAPRLSTDEHRQLLSRKFAPESVGWKLSQGCLTHMVTLASERSIRTVVVPFPDMHGFRETPYPYREYLQTICHAAHDAGAECFDIAHAIEGATFPLTISPEDSHPSAPAIARMAEEIARRW